MQGSVTLWSVMRWNITRPLQTHREGDTAAAAEIIDSGNFCTLSDKVKIKKKCFCSLQFLKIYSRAHFTGLVHVAVNLLWRWSIWLFCNTILGGKRPACVTHEFDLGYLGQQQGGRLMTPRIPLCQQERSSRTTLHAPAMWSATKHLF